ncbi:MAG: MFS transporter [Betaproteobacteria bacterium]|nr:MFS transporter [Betaproteobacteria bacterium]
MPERAAKAADPLAGLVVVGLGASLAAMDLAVNVAFPAITAAFALDMPAIRWLVICYVLTYASLMLVFGNLGDHIGHRRVFAAGLVLSLVAFVLCAVAPSYTWLLSARLVQGIGTALTLSCAPALATLLFEDSDRTKALGAYSSLYAFAGIVAPLAGGVAMTMLGWSGVFWLRAPLALLALALLPVLKPMRQPEKARALRTFDWRGPTLLATGIAALLLAVSSVNIDASSWSPVLIGLAAIGVLVVFARHQRRTPEPMLPLAAMRDSDFALTNVASVCVHFVAFAVPLLLPYYLARIEGYTAAATGAVIALSPAGMLLGSALAVPIARRTGSRRTALLGAMIVGAGSIAIGTAVSAQALAALLTAVLLHGVGLGLFQVGYTDVNVATLPHGARGVAGSLTMVTRTTGVVTAATALTAVVAAIERNHLASGAAASEAFAAALVYVYIGAGGILVVLVLLGCSQRR